MKQLFGAIEAGGTKFNCLVATAAGEILAETRILTTYPTETIGQALEFFQPFTDRGELAAIGIASFGPLDVNTNSPTYGYITSTPKQGWEMTDMVGQVRKVLNLPVAFDTDVNAAAYGEYSWNPENQGADPFLYITVGTGIGVGALVNGSLLHGLMHGEAGHQVLPHDLERDPFPGNCPFHQDCLEGLASGAAMHTRWGVPAQELPSGHPAWLLEAEYLGYGISNLILSLSPRRIVLGGGVMQHPGLLSLVQAQVISTLKGYLHAPAILEHIDQYIVAPSLGHRSGMLGAIALAKVLAGN